MMQKYPHAFKFLLALPLPILIAAAIVSALLSAPKLDAFYAHTDELQDCMSACAGYDPCRDVCVKKFTKCEWENHD